MSEPEKNDIVLNSAETASLITSVMAARETASENVKFYTENKPVSDLVLHHYSTQLEVLTRLEQILSHNTESYSVVTVCRKRASLS